MRMCQQADCIFPAHYRYTWPGKNEAFACVIHAKQLSTVAAAIGHRQQLIPLTPDEMMEGDDE